MLVSEAETLRALLEETPRNQAITPSIQTATLILLVNATNFAQITPGDDGISIPTEIQLSIPYDLDNPPTADTGILLLDQIIEELTALEFQLEQSSSDQGTDLLNVVRLDGNLSDQIQFLHNEKDKYNANLEEEQAVINELTAARDLAWENFKSYPKSCSSPISQIKPQKQKLFSPQEQFHQNNLLDQTPSST